MRVLIVEDNPTDRLLLEDIVRSRGHETAVSADAEGAWALVQEDRIPLILLDLWLPGMDGLEFVRRYRALPESDQSVIVVITGVDRREVLEEVLEAGANDYVSKPISPPVLHVRLAVAERQVRDILRRRHLEQALAKNALRDPLTDLANRTLFLERLEQAHRRARRNRAYLFAVLYLRLESLEAAEGGTPTPPPAPPVPEPVLVEAARRLEECVRAVDTVARMEEADFAILLDGPKDLSDTLRVAQRIQQAMAYPFPLNRGLFRAGASAGIAISTTEFGGAEEVVRHAQLAMTRARAAGIGGHMIYDPVLHARAAARMRQEANLRRALDREEMSLRFQPLVDLRTQEISGFEVLTYWNDPDRGLVPPGDFIPLAEQTGLIVPLGWWVLEQALAQMARWREEIGSSRRLSLSVNLSGKQFAESDVFDQIARRLERRKIPGEWLHLEITETTLMENVEATLQTLRRLKEAALRLHVDDFGTGYSSLSYLCRFPVDAVKVDRSFVQQMTYSPENLEIVKAIVRLAKNLRLGLVAEGVENREQLNLLRELECDFAQGYLFGRPVTAEEAAALLERKAGYWEMEEGGKWP